MFHHSHSSFKPSSFIISGFLIAAFSICALAAEGSQSKQKEAEATADRIFERFYKTLDFETIYQEFYISGDLRRAEVEIIINNSIRGPHEFTDAQENARIAFAAKERAYLALANFRWLSSAVKSTYEGNDAKLKNDAKEAFRLYFEPLNDKGTWPILTSEQLDVKYTSRLKKLAAFFRQHVIQANFNTEIYKTKLLKVQETSPPESPGDLKKLFKFAGIPHDAEIYVVRRERFYIYLIEQNGTFKMLSYTDRIRS